MRRRFAEPRILALAAGAVFAASAVAGALIGSTGGLLLTVVGTQAGLAVLVIAGVQVARRGTRRTQAAVSAELGKVRSRVRELERSVRDQHAPGNVDARLHQLNESLQGIHADAKQQAGRVDRRLNVMASSLDESTAHLSAVRSQIHETEQLGARVEGMASAVHESSAHLAALRSGLDQLNLRFSDYKQAGPGPELTKKVDSLSRSMAETYRQLEALLGLYAQTDPRRALPPLRGWPASPDLLLHLSVMMRRTRPELALDVGSGASTIVLGLAARANSFGRVVALEHDANYLEQTRQLIADFDLEEWAEVRLAPLEPSVVGGQEHLWYSQAAIPEGEFGLVHVDGPPEKTQKLARFPAGPLLLPRLAQGGLLILDDARRNDERQCVDRWQELFPHLQATELAMEKGAVQFQRKDA